MAKPAPFDESNPSIMIAPLLPLARYRLDWRVTETIRFPDYSGSMLRGAFGHALRQLACMTRQKECAACPLIDTCPYTTLFAPTPPANHALQKFSAIPVPYIIEPPTTVVGPVEPGDIFSFNLVLVGHALRELPLIILAWRRALAHKLGASHGGAELTHVYHRSESGDRLVYTPDGGRVLQHPQHIDIAADAAAMGETVTLQFSTPLRLQHNGHALPPDKLDARTLLMALARRVNLLAEFHGHGPMIGDFAALTAASRAIRDSKNLVWRDWTRYSSRQQQKMALGGVIGDWTLHGDLSAFADLLHLGQWLHVGKEAAFGLGGYRLLTPQHA